MIKSYQIAEVVTFLEGKVVSKETIENDIRRYKEVKGVDGVKYGSLHDFLAFKYLPERKDIVSESRRYYEYQLRYNAGIYCIKHGLNFKSSY